VKRITNTVPIQNVSFNMSDAASCHNEELYAATHKINLADVIFILKGLCFFNLLKQIQIQAIKFN
jgi:hypothetical protein